MSLRNLLYSFCCCLFIIACNPSKLNFDLIKLQNLEGNKTTIEQFKGEWVLLNFWASWCPPCIKEKPSMLKMHAHFKGKLKVVAVSDEELSKIKRFKAAKNYPFEYLKLESRHQDIGIFSIPQTYLLNPKGEVVEAFNGERVWDDEKTISLLEKYVK